MTKEDAVIAALVISSVLSLQRPITPVIQTPIVLDMPNYIIQVPDTDITVTNRHNLINYLRNYVRIPDQKVAQIISLFSHLKGRRVSLDSEAHYAYVDCAIKGHASHFYGSSVSVR